MAAQGDVQDDGSGRPAMVQPPGVPASVVAAALDAFDAGRGAGELIDLVSDSLDQPGAADRLLTFAGSGTRVLVSVVDEQVAARLQVDVDVAGADEVEELEVVVHGQQQVDVRRVGPGRWLVEPAPTGPLSFTVRAGERLVRTAWARL